MISSGKNFSKNKSQLTSRFFLSNKVNFYACQKQSQFKWPAKGLAFRFSWSAPTWHPKCLASLRIIFSIYFFWLSFNLSLSISSPKFFIKKFTRHLLLQFCDPTHVLTCHQHIIHIQEQSDVRIYKFLEVRTVIIIIPSKPIVIINLPNFKYGLGACFKP